MATVKQSQSLQGKEGLKSPSHTFPKSTASTLKEGVLFKRQRGRKSNDLRGLKFQQRYFVLSCNMLAYYSSRKEVGNQSSGTFPIARTKIVEKVPDATFKKLFCFQIGNEKEVIYLAASSDRDRDEWMEAFKIAAFALKKNQPLPRFHSGAFGKANKDHWSCCDQFGIEAEGCVESTTASTVASGDHKRDGSVPPEGSGFPQVDPVSRLCTSLPTEEILNHLESCSLPSSYNDDSAEEAPVHDLQLEELAAPTPTMYSSKQSILSGDSGKGGSVYDLSQNIDSPALHRQSKIAKHSTISSTTITEEETHISHTPLESSKEKCPLFFTCKTSFDQGEEYITSVLYRGADSVITAASNGKVSVWSRLNTAQPQRHAVFADDDVGSPSICTHNNTLVIGSSKLYFRTLEESVARKTRSYDNYLDKSPKLVAFDPDGILFCTSKDECAVDKLQLPQPNGLSSVETSTTIFQVPGQIFSLTVSPNPEEPWLAVGYRSLKDKATDYVSIFNYKTREYSKSDIEIGQNSHLCLAFSFDGRHVYIGSDLRVQSFSTHTSKPAEFNHTFKKDDSITSMCCSPVRHHLAVGLKSGGVRVFMGDPSQSATTPHSITDTKGGGAVTALTYSRDGMKTAVAFRNGSIEIWKASKPLEERPLTRTGTLEVTDKGQTYHSIEDDYTITIPEGAVKPGTVVNLHYGVAPNSPYGPYEFEDGARPVSAIISLCPEPADTEFLKPIEVTLTHFIVPTTSGIPERLFFYKTQYDKYQIENGTKVFRFEKITGCKVNHFSQCTRNQKVEQGAAMLYTTHCCDICIAGHVSEEKTTDAMLSLRQIVPINPDPSREFEVYYSLSYFLPTCDETVEKQYPKHLYDKEERVVSFSSDVENEKVLEMHTNTERLAGDWKLHFPENRLIAKENVCFWKHSYWTIKRLVQKNLYPPKITLCVQPGDMVREEVATTVTFSGVKGVCFGGTTSFKLVLVKQSETNWPAASVKSTRSSTASSPSVSYPSDPESLKKAIDKFQGDIIGLARSVDCQEFTTALFSASSQSKCPYLDASSMDKIESFMDKALSSTPAIGNENFRINSQILFSAYKIAKKFPLYICAIQEALRDHQEYQARESSQRESTSGGYTTPDEALLSDTPTTGTMSSVFTQNSLPVNGHLPQVSATQDFSAQYTDPSISQTFDIVEATDIR